MATTCKRSVAIAAGALLVAGAPVAHAGWTAPTPVRSAAPGVVELTSPALALGPRSRGSILAQRSLPDGTGVIAQGSVRRARVSALTDVLAGTSGSYAVAPAGAAAVTVRSPTATTGFFRDAGAPFGAPVALGGPFAQSRTATNARGDAVVATTSGEVPGIVAVVVRPAGGAPSPPIVISEAGAVALHDVAIGDRGHVAVAWSRGGVLEARTLEPAGLSPVAQLTPAGSQTLAASIAIDRDGVTDLAAVVPTPPPAGTSSAVAVITARRPAGGAFTGTAVLDVGSQVGALEAVAAGSNGLVTWLLTNVGPAPAYTSVTRIHAASRRGGGALRRDPVAAARGGDDMAADPRPAIASDGSAYIASSFGGAVHVAQRRPRRLRFPRPRVISTLSGGSLAFSTDNATVAAASGGRALVAWNNRDGLLRVTSLLPGARDRSGRPSSRAPRLRATPPLLDLRTVPATIRSNVSCDRPCRLTITLRVNASSTVRLSVHRVLARGGRVSIAEPISASQDRRVRRGAVRSVTTVVTASNRYGALVRRSRTVR